MTIPFLVRYMGDGGQGHVYKRAIWTFDRPGRKPQSFSRGDQTEEVCPDPISAREFSHVL
jgi:hypothetical protein